MLTRRHILIGSTVLPVLPLIGAEIEPISTIAVGELSDDLVNALTTSRLIYLTPIQSNGDESACKGEVWFMYSAGTVYVITQADAWRADAVRQGLATAKIWVGDFGLWKIAGDSYRDAPAAMLTDGALVTDPTLHEKMLPIFGEKYADEWGTWGPRFRNALRDGSRVMLAYNVAA